MKLLNIAAYKFVAIPAPADFQEPIKRMCDDLSLRGTVLLAEEGINMFLCGEQTAIESFLNFLRAEPLFGGKFAQLEVKNSFSQDMPFLRMVVRLAKEIITMRHPVIKPGDSRAASVTPEKLKQWLDQGHDDDGREVVLLDTRNDFEVDIGTFDGAVRLPIEKFSQFPDAIQEFIAHNESIKEKTIVSFCTGGIRCEKAALYMHNLNLPNTLQLDGGILRYLEDVGGSHWQGECFVFDDRIAVDTQLSPTRKNYKGRTESVLRRQARLTCTSEQER